MSESTPSVASVQPVIRTTESSVWLPATVAAVLMIAGITNVVASFGFPSAAPVEWFYSMGLSVVIIGASIALIVRTFYVKSRVRSTPRPPKVGVFSIIAALLVATSALAWAVGGGTQFLAKIAEGDRLRYMYDVNGIFLTGALWMLGVVFAVIGYRRGGGLVNTLCSVFALALGLLLLVPVLTSGIVYGLGLSD